MRKKLAGMPLHRLKQTHAKHKALAKKCSDRGMRKYHESVARNCEYHISLHGEGAIAKAMEWLEKSNSKRRKANKQKVHSGSVKEKRFIRQGRDLISSNVGIHSPTHRGSGTSLHGEMVRHKKKDYNDFAKYRLRSKIKDLKMMKRPSLPKSEPMEKANAYERAKGWTSNSKTMAKRREQSRRGKFGRDEIKGVERGVHQSVGKRGQSMMGAAVRSKMKGALADAKQKLKQLRSMKKPNLPKSEGCDD